MTISVGIFNGKGGVTKSTIARALAVAYAKAGWNVCLIDMDVLNGTVTRWVQRRMANNIEPAIAAQRAARHHKSRKSSNQKYTTWLSLMAVPTHLNQYRSSLNFWIWLFCQPDSLPMTWKPPLTQLTASLKRVYQSRKFAWCFPARLKTKLTILKPKSTWLIRHTLLSISTFPTSQL